MGFIIIIFTALAFYLLQGELYGKFWKRGLSAKVCFQDHPAVCGEDAYLTETITNAKFLPLSILRVKFKIGRELEFHTGANTAVTDNTYRNDVFSVFPWQKITRKLPMHCRKRGWYTVSQVELVSHDLFFTRHMIEILPADSELYVYPSAVDLERLNIPFQKLYGSLLSNSRLCEDPFEFRGIREYQSYDSMGSVNWKATAKTGQLKVNVHEATSSQNLLVLLNLDSEQLWASEALREESVRIAAGLAGEFVDRGVSVGIVSNGYDKETGQPVYVEAGAGPQHITECLKALSRLEYTDRLVHFEELLEAYGGNDKRENTLYVMVSSSQRPEVQLAFEGLAAESPGSFWIVPLRPEDECRIELCKSAQWMKWEVAYDKV